MSAQGSFDPTQKFNPDDSPGTNVKLAWIGWLTIAIGLVWFFSGTLSWVIWSIRRGGDSNLLTEMVLPAHTSWIANAMFVVAGVLMLKRKSAGFVLTMATCIYWFASMAFYMLYFTVRYPLGIFQNVMNFLGINFPPNVHSMSSLFINVVAILVLVGLGAREVKSAFPGYKGLQTNAYLIGFGLVAYGIFMTLLKDFVLRREPVFFQF